MQHSKNSIETRATACHGRRRLKLASPPAGRDAAALGLMAARQAGVRKSNAWPEAHACGRMVLTDLGCGIIMKNHVMRACHEGFIPVFFVRCRFGSRRH